MQTLLTRFLLLAAITLTLFACTATTPFSSSSKHSAKQIQRADSARLALNNMEEIDALVKLDNKLLARQIESVLREQALSSGDFYFRELKLRFDHQFISLESTVDIADGTGNVIAASAGGDIMLELSGDSLEWFPLFSQLHITSKDFSYGDGSYAESIPELDQLVLKRLDKNISDALRLHDNNAIPVNTVPLAEVEVGATLATLNNLTARQSQAMKGVFIVAGSASLIEPAVTSIALDLEFISDLSTCPADISVSRAVFARTITSREPRDLAQNMGSSEDLQYFYSEISGAKRPMTIIHYWFADGQPLAVSELAVGPSERWRTWSAKDRSDTGASHWRVLVVEKESGCILHSESLRTFDADIDAAEAGEDQAIDNITALRKEFSDRTSEFSIHRDRPGVALIEIRRAFLQDVYQASVADLEVEAVFNPEVLPQLQYSAQILPFDIQDVVCEDKGCDTFKSCTESIAHCVRLRDSRECSSCLFYNPLNNRCISQGEDPICMARRNTQNEKYDADRVACIAAAEAKELSCEQQNNHQRQSCEIESRAEKSTCAAVKAGIEALRPGQHFAKVSANATISGQLSTIFSNFKIENDFSSLKQDIAVKSDIDIQGDLVFQPGNIAAPLANCMAEWSASFNNSATILTSLNSMLLSLSANEKTLTAEWNGFVLPLPMTPSPLWSVFVENPQLLANCGIGLTVEEVEQAIVGYQKDFFIGQINLEIKSLPTNIRLTPATVKYGGNTYSAEAILNEDFLRYDIKK